MAKLKSFEQFLSEMDRTEEIQQDVVELGAPDEKGSEEAQAKAETVQSERDEVKELTETEETDVKEGNAFGDAVRKAKEAGEKEFEFEGETYKVEESEEVEAEEESHKSVSEMLTEVYESCKNEAKAYEDDAHDEHTVESYMKENAALIAALAAKSLKEMKEEYAVEAYEAACNSMIESYTNKMNEMKESDSAHDAEEA